MLHIPVSPVQSELLTLPLLDCQQFRVQLDSLAWCLLCLQGNHPALQLLRQRAAENSLPNDRRDACKLGLVVEGGGMRGAVSAGALLELGNLGFRQEVHTAT